MKRYPAAVMATVVLPWTESWQLDEELFHHEITTLLDNGYRHLYVFGTAGEGYAVDDGQFRQVVTLFAGRMRAAGEEPMVGIISLSLPSIIARVDMARSLGIRRFQLSLPSWGALDEVEVRTFFDAVLGRFDDCQFLHYNLLRAKRLVTATEYAAIAADHPNLVATKNSTDSTIRVRDLLEHAGTLQHFLTERGFAYGSLLGECGLLISMAAINLAQGQRYFQAGRQRDTGTLLRMEGEIGHITAAFHQLTAGGEPRIDAAYDKVLWQLHDARFPLRLLPPYRAAHAGAAERFRDYLLSTYPDWAP